MLTAPFALMLTVVLSQPTVTTTTRCEEPLGKALALAQAKRNEATELLNKAIDLCSPPQSVAEKEALAEAHVRLGVLDFTTDTKNAYAHFKEAVGLDPFNIVASLDLAASLVLLHRFNDAISISEMAIARGSEDHELLGMLEYNAGYAMLNLCVADGTGCDLAKAEKHFLRSADLKSDFPDTYFSLAAIMNDVHHDRRRAMDYFKKACDLGDGEACTRFQQMRSEFDGSFDARP